MNFGAFGGFLHDAVQLASRDRVSAVLTGEQPAMGQHHPTPLAFAPPLTEQIQQMRRQHGVAVLASLALLDTNNHALAVDVPHLEVGYL